MPSPLVSSIGPSTVVNVGSTAPIVSGRLGAFQASNGNWYLVSFILQALATWTIEVYKSTDDGATFNTHVATGPALRTYVCVFRETGDTVYFAYLNSAGNAILTTTFDCLGEAFGAGNDPSIAQTPNQTPDSGLHIAAAPNGDIVLAWTRFTSLAQTDANVFAKVYIGGVWGLEITVNAIPRATADNVLLVGNDVGILWSDWTVGGVGSSFDTRVSLHYSVISGGALVATTTAMLDASKVNDQGISWPVLYPGVYDSANDTIGFPVGQETNPHTPTITFEMDVIVGTNASSGTPSFTTVPVFTVTDGTEVVSMPRLAGPIGAQAPFSAVYMTLPTGSTAYFTGINPPPAGIFTLMWASIVGVGTLTLQNSVASALAGAWSAPGTYLDTGSTGHDPYYDLWINSDVGAVETGTLTLQKIIGPGLQAVTTDFTLSAVGPETVSGAGSVGPVSVTPGTYALSETSLLSQYISRGFVCTGGTQVGQDITIAAGDTVVCTILNDPVVLTAGGRAFVKLTLNFFNACLGREYLLYQLINRELLKCGVKPFCFCIDERDWGGNFSEHEEVPMGPPEGAIAFNPTGQIPLPTIASGDNTIFQFRVPIGYDGVILGQYHQYITDPSAFPPPIFVEGSGDIVWRLECAGRFMRDCGEMEVSIGSLQNTSPIAGGLQVRSNDLIRYVVAAPNTSGALTAGVGNIVAGLHGWQWPRK